MMPTHAHARCLFPHRLVSALLLLALGGAVHAGEPREPEAAPRVAIILLGRDQGPRAKEIAQALGGDVSGEDQPLRVQWVPSLGAELSDQISAGVRACPPASCHMALWVDVGAGDRVYVLSPEPSGFRVWYRSVVEQRVGTHGRLEAITAIIRAAVGSFAGAQGTDDGPPPRFVLVETGDAAARRAARPFGAVTAGYALRGFSSAAPLQHAVTAAATLYLQGRWYLTAGYAFAPKTEAEDQGVTLTLQRHGLRLGGGVFWRFGRFFIETEGAVALGLLPRSTRVDGDGEDALEATEDALDLDVGLEVAARARYCPWNAVCIQTGPTVAFMVLNPVYEAQQGGQTLTILAPWVVQPIWTIDLVGRFGAPP